MSTVIEKTINDQAYQQNRQHVWEKTSAIRTRPRRLMAKNDVEQGLYFFPLARQPLCVHPDIVNLGEKAKQYILLQSSFKFMMDVAVLETEIVNHGALLVANNKLHFDFPPAIRHDALSVIIDEAYHAYVAIDFIRQVEFFTQVHALAMPSSTAVMQAISYVQAQLALEFQELFFLIAVCIGEHVLTKDLIAIGRDHTVCKIFSQVMADHVLDEGRHAGIFAEIMTWLWEHMSEKEKIAIGNCLPSFMQHYLKNDIQQEFDRSVLKQLPLTAEQINKILSDTYIPTCNKKLNKDNPVISNLIAMLTRCRVLEHQATRYAFEQSLDGGL